MEKFTHNQKLDTNAPCTRELTETQLSFAPPKIKKVMPTRANRMEQFLWQEMFEEYKRQNAQPVDLGKNQTEYYDQYCKDLPVEDKDRKEVVDNKYPLYCTTAITLWNHDGDATKTFRKSYSITRPIQECSEKFAP
ncbi:uncharacterized protein Dwil_GK23309 [Drosophila willistoni]|uniref:Uncharacterized protein n=1 Tax=Drosophila willistoni TaxID=7260 RepID=B4NNG5_DROWI|nr:uncharacterized protein LOC6652309 [Drosophila willistoni]EDW85904.1 uncharacterized protein Dwil_GK23309 [Drosophila willistoni]